ncbi:hypothetical protein [Actinomycetospora chiangmaiensis]|uniref:hypothetical protein n=1 Tax=Actinomycetospora chiangmaiensis TaxID=402650 RepID=UPI00037FDCBD|nr:hypothetical protein [Actinomycetospora chiangmaiensis]
MSWSVADARAVELSPAAVAFAVLSSDAADPAVEFAPFAVDVAVEFVEAADEAFDAEPDAVDVAFEAPTAVDDACALFPGADAVAVESCAPELAAAPVGLPVFEVAVLRPDAAAVAGPPEDVVVAVDGVVGFSAVPPPAWACADEPWLPLPAPEDPDPVIGPVDALAPGVVPSPIPALPAAAPSEPGALDAAPAPEEGPPEYEPPAPAPAPVVLVWPVPFAVSGPVVVVAVAEGGGGVYCGSVSPPLAAEAAAEDAFAGVVPVAGV